MCNRSSSLRCQGEPGYLAVHGKLLLKLKMLPAIDRFIPNRIESLVG